jgi:hypothetical protein
VTATLPPGASWSRDELDEGASGLKKVPRAAVLGVIVDVNDDDAGSGSFGCPVQQGDEPLAERALALGNRPSTVVVVGSPWSTEAVPHSLCDQCATPTTASAGQSIQGDRLEWSWSVCCPGCGCTVEICGRDEIPDQIRTAIIARDGLARLWADPLADRLRRVDILAVFRRGGMTLGEAVAAYAQLTGDGITGLPVELQLLANRLTHVGAVVVSADEHHRPAS